MCKRSGKRWLQIVKESFAKLDFWLKSRLSEFQKRSLLIVNKAFEILSNEELGQKAGFSKDSTSAFFHVYVVYSLWPHGIPINLFTSGWQVKFMLRSCGWVLNLHKPESKCL
ncbi:MAG: hypothetical protein AAF600_19945 [Bacteroidota bacterium]